MEAQAGFSGRMPHLEQRAPVLHCRCRRRRPALPCIVRASNIVVSVACVIYCLSALPPPSSSPPLLLHWGRRARRAGKPGRLTPLRNYNASLLDVLTDCL